MPDGSAKPVVDAVAETTKRRRGRPPGRASDVFGGELRRRDVFPLLVLHLVSRDPSFGNRLIEEIEEITQGVITVNPNTMYPLLRDLEGRGLIEGAWEHPDRRTRRFYSITEAGREEYERLRDELGPFLDSMKRTVTLLQREIYGTR
jgi:DNA-binding PadR family transcriptional regulator